MGWSGKDFKAHPVPIPCQGLGCHPLDQAAQGPIQPGSERLQGWGIHSISVQNIYDMYFGMIYTMSHSKGCSWAGGMMGESFSLSSPGAALTC